MKILAIIPARGGSKGLPGKNIRHLAGKPLIAHSIEHARKSDYVTRVIVSTDSQAISDVAKKFDAEVLERPPAISGDTATSETALLHCIEVLRQTESYVPDLVCFLQCTSPIRSASDIDAAIDHLLREDADSLVTVSPSHRFLWRNSSAGALSINYDITNRPRRQDMEPQYVENGSFYLFKPELLIRENNRLGGRIALYVMSEAAAHEIDSASDFEYIEALLTHINTHDH